MIVSGVLAICCASSNATPQSSRQMHVIEAFAICEIYNPEYWDLKNIDFTEYNNALSEKLNKAILTDELREKLSEIVELSYGDFKKHYGGNIHQFNKAKIREVLNDPSWDCPDMDLHPYLQLD
ncbi:hypothetical protein KP814_08445 [Hahella sp. HN01]|nr:hypothetical protein [Hahella sp. HN01]